MSLLKTGLSVVMVVSLSSATGASGNLLDAGGAVPLIERLYNYPADAFDLGKFAGRYQPKRRCALMKEFFAEELLKSAKSGDCDVVSPGDAAFRRYPSLEPEDAGPDTESVPVPKTHITSSRLAEGKAVVKVEFKGDAGRVVYFLKVTDRGWRIENALSYPIWPISMPPQGCSQLNAGGYFYLREPSSPDELEDLPKACRELERRYLGDRSKRGQRQ